MPIKTIIESFASAHNDERFINGGGSSCITAGPDDKRPIHISADGGTKLTPVA